MKVGGGEEAKGARERVRMAREREGEGEQGGAHGWWRGRLSPDLPPPDGEEHGQRAIETSGPPAAAVQYGLPPARSMTAPRLAQCLLSPPLAPL